MPRNPEVDRWFVAYDNPMKPVVMAIRDAVLGGDPRVGECIKWQAPTFTFAGNLASFFPKSRQHASLMFHEGAKIPGTHPILQGEAKTGRVVKLASLAEVKAAKKELQAVVKAWIAWKGAGAAASVAKAKRKTTKTMKTAKAKPPAAKARARNK